MAEHDVLRVQVAEGQLTLNGETLNTGDGAALSRTKELAIRGTTAAKALVFDLN